MSLRAAWRWTLRSAGAVLLLALAAVPASAQTTEAQVKAAYLFKLASFVTWPGGGEGSSFRYCIAGRPDIAAVLEQLAGNQQIDGRRVVITRLRGSDADEVRDCRVLFLGRGGETSAALFAAAGRAPVLTVTDRNGGTRGGAVEFVLRDGRVRFVIRRGEADSRQLALSSKLLEVALEVEP